MQVCVNYLHNFMAVASPVLYLIVLLSYLLLYHFLLLFNKLKGSFYFQMLGWALLDQIS